MQVEMATKVCTKCKISKSLEEFHVEKKGKFGRCSCCKVCRNSYKKQHYSEMPVEAKRKRNRRNGSLGSKQSAEFLSNAKKNIRCAECGCEGPREIFDAAHLTRQSKKRRQDGRVIRHMNILQRNSMKKELEKCRWLCAYCHRLETVKEIGKCHPGRRYHLYFKRHFLIQEKLRIGECIDCKRRVTIDNFSAFEFDHIPGATKRRNLSQMISYSFDNILEELEKCQLRCVCCHRKITEVRRLEGFKTQMNGLNDHPSDYRESCLNNVTSM